MFLLSKDIASSQLGRSWFASTISSTRSLVRLRFLSLKKDVARPRLPIRPVRPILGKELVSGTDRIISVTNPAVTLQV